MPTTKPKKEATKKAATKKVAKRAVKIPAKKAPVKKVTKTTRTQAPLATAKDEQAFWMTDGQILKTLLDLQDALAEIDADVFAHHVTKDRNDFAEWVEHVICDAECAAALRKATRSKSAHTVVVRFVKKYGV